MERTERRGCRSTKYVAIKQREGKYLTLTPRQAGLARVPAFGLDDLFVVGVWLVLQNHFVGS